MSLAEYDWNATSCVNESCHTCKGVMSPTQMSHITCRIRAGYHNPFSRARRRIGRQMFIQNMFSVLRRRCAYIYWLTVDQDWCVKRKFNTHIYTDEMSLRFSFKRILPTLCDREHLKHQSKPLTVFLRRTRVCSANHVFPIQHVLHTMIQSWVHLVGLQSQMKSNYMRVFLFYRSTNNDCAKEYNE